MIISKGAFEVLLALFKEKNLNFNAIARKTKLSVTGVSKIIKSLEKDHIINTIKIGRSIVVRLNPNQNNLELFSLAEKYNFKRFYDEHPKLRSFLKLLKSRCKDEIVLVFGSYASGEESSKSDLDLLIISDKTKYKLLEGLLELTKITITPIFITKSDFIKQAKKKHRLYNEIINGKRILINGEYRFWEMTLELKLLLG